MNLPLKKINKEKKMKQSSNTKKESKTIIIIILSIIAAASAFLFLVNIEKNILTNYEKKETVVASAEVPVGIIFDKNNVKKYFTIEERESITIPSKSFKTLDELYGLSTNSEINAKTIPTKIMFSNIGALKEEIGEAITTSIAVSEISQTVSGSLRAGDYICIYASALDEFTKEQSYFTKKAWQKVYIVEARDAGGLIIDNGNKEAQAMMLTVMINKNDMESFYTDLYSESMKIAKVTELVNNGTFVFDESKYKENKENEEMYEEPQPVEQMTETSEVYTEETNEVAENE